MPHVPSVKHSTQVSLSLIDVISLDWLSFLVKEAPIRIHSLAPILAHASFPTQPILISGQIDLAYWLEATLQPYTCLSPKRGHPNMGNTAFWP